jgi:phosphoglycerate dehydrogenase-like enzyme
VGAVRCVILDDYQDVARSYADWSVLPDVEVEVVTEHVADHDRLVEILAGAEIAVVMRERTPVPRSLLERLPDLRLLVTTGSRNASIDLAAARERGVVVCGTESSPDPPGELTWALILGLARHVVREDAAFHADGPWQSTVGRELHGSTLGLVGLGRIGARVSRVAQAFGMDVVAWSPHLTEERAAAAGARLAPSLVALMAESDWVSVHMVLSDATRGLVDQDAIDAMKPSAYLVNTSRAGLVDTDALVAALDAGRIAGAGLDVYDVEPVPAGDPLRRLRNVLATPHLGYVVEGNYRRFYTQAVEDVAAWLAGSPVRVLDERSGFGEEQVAP